MSQNDLLLVYLKKRTNYFTNLFKCPNTVILYFIIYSRADKSIVQLFKAYLQPEIKITCLFLCVLGKVI